MSWLCCGCTGATEPREGRYTQRLEVTLVEQAPEGKHPLVTQTERMTLGEDVFNVASDEEALSST